MSHEIKSTDTICKQARRAAEADYKAGRTVPDCPYQLGTPYAKRWYAAYLEHECELHKQQVVSTFAHGPVEQLEVV